MKTLHVVRKLDDPLPFELLNRKEERGKDTLLLIHDAVFHRGPLPQKAFASAPDIAARGITSPLPTLTDEAICQLIIEHDRIIVW
jgi:sulfur transfer complex TusBCD TusB component (DsrH family)